MTPEEVVILNRIPRIEDLPYWMSPPIQFTFTQSADLTGGTYPFTAARAEVANNKNLNDNTLLFVRDITFQADIPVLDYQEAIKLAAGTTDIPTFQMFFQSDAQSPVLADAIQLGSYFENQVYKLLLAPKQEPNTLSAFFRGTLQQTAALAGIGEINLTMNVFVQYIQQDVFVELIKKGYPQIEGGRY